MAKSPKGFEMPNEYFVNCTFEIYVTQKHYSSIYNLLRYYKILKTIPYYILKLIPSVTKYFRIVFRNIYGN